MKPSLTNFVAIIDRAQIPEHLQRTIVPALQHSNKQEKTITLMQSLEWQRTQRNKALAKERQDAMMEGRSMSFEILQWPSNLRLEPALPKAKFANMQKDMRKKIKNLMKEQ